MSEIKTPEQIAEDLNKSIATFKEQVDKAATKEEIAAVNEAIETFKNEQNAKLEGLATSKALKELEDRAIAQGKAITELKSGGKATVKTLAAEFIEKKDAIKDIARGGHGEVEIKALTTRGSITNNASGFFLPEIGQLGVKERSLYNVLPKVNVSDSNNGGTIRYRDWDEATIVRAAAMVAEGAAFPESKAAFEWYTKDLRKVGDTLPVTEEFFEDEAQAAAELDMFLTVNVETEIDSQLVNGDNTGQNLDGIFNSSPAYTPVASGIASANLKDLAIKVRNDITRSRGSKYRPDMMLVSSSTMEGLVLAKDANNNYIFDENTGTLGGLAVVVDENTPDNAIVVGDRRYARIYEKTGLAISRGMVNNQFNEDEMTLKARKRLLLLIREVDKTGFRKVTDVDAALTTLSAAVA
ncbi:hypothetical protein AAU57_11990 [Nonlabens sp. YIK11]|uniref:phage major capsid family protein n=1 Tax=Nonlabens sp. YIK11 TaxID=1453349 RepID=UPI0006DC515C|nr:phage major capsid protein [Nonlabens sp. YIK11]KQC33969.1 hypothetical protein AAU57_11990 [Nonlabens sp. YIK11]